MTKPFNPSRRQMLSALSALAGAGALGCKTPTEGSTDTDVAADPRLAIDHFVILMMENRSYDHVFGSLTLDEGRTELDGLTAEMFNLGPDGEAIHPHALTHECIVDPGHSWTGSRAQFDNGLNDGFATDYALHTGAPADEVLGYLNRATIPVTYALADEYAVCDRWFCSVMGPTWPNRFFSYAASSNGLTSNDRTAIPVPLRTVFSQLTEAGVTWAVYANIPAVILIEGILATGNVRPLDEFFSNLAAGTLPQVVFLEPDYGSNDDHPPAPARLGQVLIASIYQALAESSVWDRCAFILDYDEHGGFFDHVAPPTMPDERAAEGFNQLGFRIPAMVMGPYARQAGIHTEYDHTAVIKTLQERFGIAESLNKRNDHATALWDCFDLEAMAARTPRAPITLPVIEVNPDDYDDTCFQPSSLTGQPELEAAFDAGQLPSHFDRRLNRAEDLEKLLARAARMGVVKLTG